MSDADADRMAQAAAAAGNMADAARLVVDRNSGPGSFDRLPATLKQMFIDNARALTVPGPREPAEPITCQQLGRIRVPVTITEGALTGPARRIMDAAAHRCIPQSQLVTNPKRAPRRTERESVGVQRGPARVPGANRRCRWVSRNIYALPNRTLHLTSDSRNARFARCGLIRLQLAVLLVLPIGIYHRLMASKRSGYRPAAPH